MEIIIGIVAIIWMAVAMVVLVKSIANASITINVKHENAVTPLEFNDIYDNEGDAKDTPNDVVDLSEVFKEFNELMLGDEVKSDG